MFSQLKARRPGAPDEGTTRVRPSQTLRFGGTARAVRPLGFAAIAVAAAVVVAGCKPGTYSHGASSGGASSSGSHAGTTSPASAFSLASQQTQSIRSFTAHLEIQATGALNATLAGTLREVTAPTPIIAIRAHAGALGNIRVILTNGMAYVKSPLLMRSYGKPWVMGSASSMSSASGLNLGPLLSLLSTSSPLVQVPLFSQGQNTRMMGHPMMMNGMRVSEWGGHYMLSNVLGSLNSQMRPSFQSMMSSGVAMTRFRAWMDSSHRVRKLVLIDQGTNTRIVITLVITSINRPMHIQIPPTALIFVLGGAPAPTPSMTATPTVQPTVTTTPTMGATPTPAPTSTGVTTSPTPVPTGAGPTHW